MPSKWDIFALSERMMAMDDAAWARHANPWSVYSRMSILPLMTLAIYSRVWLGGVRCCLWRWWFYGPGGTLVPLRPQAPPKIGPPTDPLASGYFSTERQDRSTGTIRHGTSRSDGFPA